jgi:NAD(P)-dependent dehydrogenase (short-subunit alcohol dehydrogenase family)
MASVAVVTGGGSGFGRAVAGRCAARGFAVALLDIDGSRVRSEAEGLAGEHGVATCGLRVDVGEPQDVERAAGEVERQLGGADLVFSNVGVQQIGALERFSDEAWAWMLDINVVGAARITRSFLPLLRRSHQPRLVFTASSSVLVPASRLAAYQASKFAVLGLAETLRVELAGEGIGVSVIFPSGMMTRHIESSLAARPAGITEAIAPAEDTEALVSSNPFISQVASAEDAARAAVDEVLAGEPYVVTHGDLVAPVAEQQALVRQAVERARSRGSGT